MRLESVLQDVNNWLSAHNYEPLIISAVKDKLDDPWLMPYPYDRILYVIKSLQVIQDEEHYKAMLELYLSDAVMNYQPVDKGGKAGEQNPAINPLSHNSKITDAPNDYGVNLNRFYKELKK